VKSLFLPALRLFRSSPGFCAAAVATLALGIGANAAVFSVARAVLLSPPAFARPDRVVALWERNPREGDEENPPSASDFDDWRRGTRSFERLALVDARLEFNLAEGGQPERVNGAAVDPALFEVVGVTAARGRTFDPAEREPGRDGVVLLSDGLWNARFGRDPSVVGRRIAMDGASRTVVGIMPAGFVFPADAGTFGNAAPPPRPALWVPLALPPAQRAQRSSHWLLAFGLLRPGVSAQRAGAEVSAIQSAIAASHPADYVGTEVEVVRVVDQAVRSARPALLLLSAAVGFVLLVACANVAGLLLSRSEARRREMAIRRALGAGRARLLGQLLAESLVLALAGAAAGAVLAGWSLPAIRAYLPLEFIGREGVRFDGAALGFTAGLTGVAALLFGLVPALELSAGGRDIADAIGSASRGSTEARRANRLRRALTISQVAIALVLATGAGLLGKSLWRLLAVSPGVDIRGVETAELTLAPVPYAARTDRARFVRDVVGRLAADPAVAAAGATTQLPLSGENMNFAIAIEGRPENPGEFPSADVRAVTPGYFAAVSIPIVRGRLFRPEEGAATPHVAVVNETLIRKYFPRRDPIGRRITLGVNSFEATIVGIVRDVREIRLDLRANEQVYVLYEQAPFWRSLRLVVRAARGSNPVVLAPAIREAVHALDAGQAVAAVRPLEQIVAGSVAQPKLRAALVGAFGAIALALAAIGLYGLLAYSVARRTREIGVRMALGARPTEVLRLFVSEGLGLALAGVAAGLAGSLALSRLLSSFLFAVAPADPAALGAATLLLLVVAAAASAIPAFRASRIDPLAALRSE
jgi:putative ABC transport system permease protein